MKRYTLLLIVGFVALIQTNIILGQQTHQLEKRIVNATLKSSINVPQSCPDTLFYNNRAYLLKVSPLLFINNYLNISQDYNILLSPLNRGVICSWEIKNRSLFLSNVDPLFDIKKTSIHKEKSSDMDYIESIRNVLHKKIPYLKVDWFSGCLQAIPVLDGGETNQSIILEFGFDHKGALYQITENKLKQRIIYSKYRNRCKQ